jgi:hypothetical protein
MEESFLLKHYGHIDIDEQYNMTGEERIWWLKRIEEENRRIAEKNSQTHTPGKIPESPGRPPV